MNQFLRDLPIGWTEVTAQFSRITAAAGLAAYSGGALVRDGERPVFIVRGGGHNDYGGDEHVHIDMETLTMSRPFLSKPELAGITGDHRDAGVATQLLAMWDALELPAQPGWFAASNGATARPISKHEYNGVCYVPGTGMVQMGGLTFGTNPPWEWRPVDYHVYDITAEAGNGEGWSTRTVGGVGFTSTDAGQQAICWSPDTQRIYMNNNGAARSCGVDGVFSNDSWSYGSGVETSMTAGGGFVFSGGGFGGTLAFDMIDVATGQNQSAPALPFTIQNGGMEYADGGVFIHHWTGQTARFDVAARTWEVLPSLAGGIVNWVCGRFFYLPDDQIFILIEARSDADWRFYAFRYAAFAEQMQVDQRTDKAIRFIDPANPARKRIVSALGVLNYRSDPDGVVDAGDIDCTPQAVTGGLEVRQNDYTWFFGERNSEPGWFMWGGRAQGVGSLRASTDVMWLRYSQCGHLFWPSRTFTSLGTLSTFNDTPTYNAPAIQTFVNSYAQGLVTKTVAELTTVGVWTTPGGGSIDFVMRVLAGKLVWKMLVNEQARTWIEANAPPGPLPGQYFGFLLDTDMSATNHPRNQAGVVLDWLTVDSEEALQCEDASNRFIGQIDATGQVECLRAADPGPDERVPLNQFVVPTRQRVWNGQMFIGAPWSDLIAMATGGWRFD